MELNLTAARRPRKLDRTIERRAKLSQQIENQLAKLRGENQGKAHRGAWYWRNHDGWFLLSIRYGHQDIELADGMYSILCENLGEVESSLLEVHQLVQTGALDDTLRAVSAELRSKFTKS